MPSGSFFGIETGLRALRTAQTSLDTASHNIANVNTPGYSRQRAERKAADPYTVPAANRRVGAYQIGTGVEAVSIQQARDYALDEQARVGYGDRAALLARRDALSSIEAVLGEPGKDALSAGMTRFFNTFQDLANDPESAAARRAALAGAAEVAGSFRQIRRQIDDIDAGLAASVQGQLGEVNGLAAQIAALNAEIRQLTAQGDQPNDLRDRRGLLLDELAKKVNTTVLPAADGTLSVQIGGAILVRGAFAEPIADVSELTATGDLRGGELRGLLEARGRIEQQRGELDGLANTFAEQVNALHQAGRDGTGASGLALFTGTNAKDIALNLEVAGRPERIAASGAASAAASNADTALAIAGLANRRVTAGPVRNETLRDYWSGVTAGLGAEVRALEQGADGADAFVAQLEARRDAVSGVSLDEEMADLVKFQRSYQAAARLISLSDELTEGLLATFGAR